MNVHYECLNDMICAKIIQTFETVKSYTENYDAKNLGFNASA